MNMQEFAAELAAEIRRQADALQTGFLGQGIVNIEMQTVRKNNNQIMDAMVIYGSDPGVAPTLYLAPLYDMYKNGRSISHLGADVIRALNRVKMPDDGQIEKFFDYGQIRSSIYCRLVSKEWNREMLKELCYEEWHDLAVTYYYSMDSCSCEDGIVQVRKDFLEKWGVTQEQVAKDAWFNTLRDQPAVLEPLEAALERMRRGKKREDNEDRKSRQYGGPSLYLLTNPEKMLGSVVLAYPGQLEITSYTMGGDYYVIPSSIHECLILAEDGAHTADELGKMVREVNQMQVSPQEMLTDHVYYYSQKDHTLTACGLLQ